MLSPALMLSSNEETFFANVIKGAPDQQKLLSHRKKKSLNLTINVVNDFSDHRFINGIGDGIMLSEVTN
ncbi:hypothetical protein BHM03_00056044 [Ensete ventricosum]|nr:hypothetical protein BHM03_00056044 [Ensete ventricosum]